MARHRRQPITAQNRLSGASPTPDEVTSGLEATLAELQADGTPEPEPVEKIEALIEKTYGEPDDEPELAPTPVNAAPREKTLHELNLEARAIDRYHAEQRQAADDLIREQVEPMLVGIQRPRQRNRRYQKNLRAPVKP